MIMNEIVISKNTHIYTYRYLKLNITSCNGFLCTCLHLKVVTCLDALAAMTSPNADKDLLIF
jgi:hypothetical protein